MPVEISKNEFKRLIERELIEFPPFQFEGKVWGWRVESEDNPRELVYAVV